MRPIAPLSSEKLNLCSDSSTSSIKSSDSKKSLKNVTNSTDWKHKPLKPIHKVTRKYRSRSANPPSGPSKVVLPPMIVNQSSGSSALSSINASHIPNGRPVSLMRGSILTNNPLSSNISGNPTALNNSNGEGNLLNQITTTPVVPQLQLRMIQSAPTVSRSVNLPPILQSKTPSKKLQSHISPNHNSNNPQTITSTPTPTTTTILPNPHVTPTKSSKNSQFNKQTLLTPIEKKESYEEYEETGGILAPRK